MNASKTGAQSSKTNKRVVSIKGHVGWKFVLEKLGVWTREYMIKNYSLKSKVFQVFKNN